MKNVLKELNLSTSGKESNELRFTVAQINYDIEGKEYIYQKLAKKYRCISWHPHYIMTKWKNSLEDAMKEADDMVSAWYDAEGGDV